VRAHSVLYSPITLRLGVVERVPGRPIEGPDAFELELLGEPGSWSRASPRRRVRSVVRARRMPFVRALPGGHSDRVITKTTPLAVAAFQARIFLDEHVDNEGRMSTMASMEDVGEVHDPGPGSWPPRRSPGRAGHGPTSEGLGVPL